MIIKGFEKCIIVLCLCIIMCFTGCGGSTGTSQKTGIVPDERIEIEVKTLCEDYSDYLSYSFETKHKPNETTHTDQVEVTTYVEYEYGSYELNYVYHFEYNKTTDLWSVISKTGSKTPSIKWKKEKLTGRWSGIYEFIGNRHSFSIDITDIDKMSLNCSWSLPAYSDEWVNFKQVFYLEMYNGEGLLKGEYEESYKRYPKRVIFGIKKNPEDSSAFRYLSISPLYGVQLSWLEDFDDLEQIYDANKE